RAIESPAVTENTRRALATFRKRGGRATPAYQSAAPWPEDLDQRAEDALRLPDRHDMPSGSFDIIVIGAGVAGLNAALGAQSTGARVLVLEAAASVGTGATGRNAGILSAGINMGLADLPKGSPVAELWPATTKELLALAREAGRPDTLLSASLTGAISLAETPTAAHHLEQEAEARINAGLRAQTWSREEVARATSGRLDTTKVLAALWLPDEGRIQPLTLLAHLAENARRAGISLVGSARVRRWEADHAGTGRAGWQLYLEDGTTAKACGLILATGPTTLPTARLYALSFHATLPETFPLFWDSAPYTYCDFRPGHGRLTVSGGRYGKPGAFHRDYVYHRRLTESAHRWIPELRREQPAYAWAVDIEVSRGMVPEARRIDNQAPGYSIVGLGALGVLPGGVLGRRAGIALGHEIV
ncbi:MAG: FAD-dependent oxidoreductase, partial [Ktedonobacterales bacterium]